MALELLDPFLAGRPLPIVLLARGGRVGRRNRRRRFSATLHSEASVRKGGGGEGVKH